MWNTFSNLTALMINLIICIDNDVKSKSTNQSIVVFHHNVNIDLSIGLNDKYLYIAILLGKKTSTKQNINVLYVKWTQI